MRTFLAAVLGTALLGLAGLGGAGEKHSGMGGMDEMVFVESRFSYPETVKRIKAAIRAQGMYHLATDEESLKLLAPNLHRLLAEPLS